MCYFKEDEISSHNAFQCTNLAPGNSRSKLPPFSQIIEKQTVIKWIESYIDPYISDNIDIDTLFIFFKRRITPKEQVTIAQESSFPCWKLCGLAIFFLQKGIVRT